MRGVVGMISPQELGTIAERADHPEADRRPALLTALRFICKAVIPEDNAMKRALICFEVTWREMGYRRFSVGCERAEQERYAPTRASPNWVCPKYMNSLSQILKLAFTPMMNEINAYSEILDWVTT